MKKRPEAGRPGFAPPSIPGSQVYFRWRWIAEAPVRIKPPEMEIEWKNDEMSPGNAI